MKKIFKKKLQRLLVSKNMMKILFGFHFLTGGYKSKKIDISFKNKKNRLEIVQNILNLKKYRSYLEIGTFKNDLFNHVKCNVKVGVVLKSFEDIKEGGGVWIYVGDAAEVEEGDESTQKWRYLNGSASYGSSARASLFSPNYFNLTDGQKIRFRYEISSKFTGDDSYQLYLPPGSTNRNNDYLGMHQIL